MEDDDTPLLALLVVYDLDVVDCLELEREEYAGNACEFLQNIQNKITIKS